MDSFSSAGDVNTNVRTEDTFGQSDCQVDLGKEFVTKDPEDFGEDSPVANRNQLFIQYGQPFVAPEGFLSLVISKDLRIDFNTNHSVCVTTPMMKIAVDHLGLNIGVIHPFGRVFQEYDKSSVHMECGLHLAKMCHRGVTFTSLCRSLIYLVDTSGCKTTTERFRKLSYDFTADIFYANSLTGDVAKQRSFADLCRSGFEISKSGQDKFWWLSGVKIHHNMVNGSVVISKIFNQIHINIHPTKNYLRICSPTLRIVANSNAETYFQVIKPHPRDEQRVSATVNRFQVKNGSQKAGFDINDELVLM